MLKIDHVNSGYNRVQVLWGVSLEVGANEIVCLIGSNGAGKTTLLRTISGIVPVWSGAASFQGEDLSRLASHDIVTRGIAHVPEGRRLFQTMSVRDNLLMGAYRRRDRDVAGDLASVFDLFPVLAERRDQTAGTLSGGEQQMCAIGRAIMSRPKLLLIDELSLGLAPRVVEIIAAALAQIRDAGISILLVEQDVVTALELATRGFVLDNGKISTSGSSAELIDHPLVRQSYIGV